MSLNPLDSNSGIEGLRVYQSFEKMIDELQAIEDSERLIIETGTITREVVSSIESLLPGVITQEVPLSTRYSDQGMSACLESLELNKVALIDKLTMTGQTLIGKLKETMTSPDSSVLADGLISSTSTLSSLVKQYVPNTKEYNQKQYTDVYKNLMGIPADSKQDIEKLATKIPKYSNPLLCLTEYDNKAYDQMFSPLLLATAVNGKKIHTLLSDYTNNHSSDMAEFFGDTITLLNNIANEKSLDAVSKYNAPIALVGVSKLVPDLAVTMGLSKYIKSDISQTALGLSSKFKSIHKVSKVSLSQKPTMVEYLAKGTPFLDDIVSTLSELTDDDKQFDKAKYARGNADKQTIRKNQRERTFKEKVNDKIYSKKRSQAAMYKQMLKDIKDVWNIWLMFVNLAFAYAECRRITRENLIKFNLNTTKFVSVTTTGGS